MLLHLLSPHLGEGDGAGHQEPGSCGGISWWDFVVGFCGGISWWDFLVRFVVGFRGGISWWDFRVGFCGWILWWDFIVVFRVSLLGTWIMSSPSQFSSAPPCEVHHHLVGRRSFISLKLRKQPWKQRPQNNPKQGWFCGAFEFLTPLGSKCDFSALK